MNSRTRFRADDEKPSNTSRGKGLILETPYKPGFVDDKDLETVKMAVDKELSEISNAFYQTTERTADTIKRIDEIKIEGDGLLAKIEEVDRVSKEGDIALAERITTVKAELDTDIGKNTALITEETRARTDADTALSERITTVKAELDTDIGKNTALITDETRARTDADTALSERITTLSAETASGLATLTQEMSVVSGKTGKLEAKWGIQTNVNDKVSGIQLNNDGKSSSFSVIADKFTVSDGTNSTSPPFAVVGNNTRVNSLYVNTIQSDNWNGSSAGWHISNNGAATFNNVTVRGHVEAASGSFKGDLTGATGTFSGGLNVIGAEGNARMQITNNQILVYDDSGRLRIRIGKLS